jgi:hypothetical protein
LRRNPLALIQQLWFFSFNRIMMCDNYKGLRIVDTGDPFKPKEVGYYIPDTTDKTKPRLKKVIQTNDVDLDYRGLIYVTDRAGTGLHILEYMGGK